LARTRFSRQVLENTGSQIIGAICAFGVSVVVSRLLGAHAQGQMTLLLTVPWLVGLPLEFGVGAAGVAAVATGRIGLRELRAALTVVTGILLVGALVAQLPPVVRVAARALPSLGGLGVRVILAASFATAAATMFRYVQVAAGRLGTFAVMSVLDRVLLLVGVLVLWKMGVLSESSMVLACAAAYGASFLAGCVASRIPTTAAWRTSAATVRLLARSGWRIALANGLQMLNYRLDVVILSALSGAAATGIYSIAGSIASLLWYLPNGAATVLLSRLGRMDAGTAPNRTAKIAGATGALVLILAALVAGIGRPAIAAIFGREFEGSYVPLLLLLPGVVALALPKVVNSYLITVGRTHVAMYASVVGVISTVALDLLLIPRWGASGAAVGSSVAYALFTVVVMAGFHRVDGLSPRAYLVTLEDMDALKSSAKWGQRRGKN
jgi:O-antigen/teichoic acid export membrane protein